MSRTLRLGTRGSLLARAQSQQVADLLTARTGVPVELVILVTRGDRDQSRPLAALGGKGLFTAELEEGLRDGSLDFAVHSLKDLPTEDAEGLCLGAIPEREDPRDALIGYSLADLPQNAHVGTGSLRRREQLLNLRPDLRVSDIRGNVETRLRKRDEGQYDAILLACAGLARLGIARADLHPLDPTALIPAPGQGALGIQCRSGDTEILGVLSAIDDGPTRACVQVERTFLRTFGGGCNVPAACFAQRLPKGELSGIAWARPDEGPARRVSATGTDPIQLGFRLASALSD